MHKEVFRREERVLTLAREALADDSWQRDAAAFSALVAEYEKLCRQSRRLVTMGDRMQQTLGNLNRDLAESERKYRSIFENVTEGIYRCDSAGRLVEVNPAMAAMFGCASPEAFVAEVGLLHRLFCDPDDYRIYEALLASGDARRYEARVRAPGSESLWVEISASAVEADGVGLQGVVGVLVDVTERKDMIEEMCRLARTDSLTGMWNRGYFMELAGRELNRARRKGGDLALLMIDVDHFKAINDTHGHDVGDMALVELARIFGESVREVDVAARLGGEEFGVLLPDASAEDACAVAARIARAVRSAAIESVAGTLRMTVSIGLASLEQPQDSIDSLLKYSDIALYAAKKNGRDRVEVYRRSVCPRRSADNGPGCPDGSGG
ncbi:sensor domain-containing diguanylate cyclase [Pseudodesulfovibrio alkaliphilus]|uniref:sensor domain-containing diguanylate cyclase n=1 Tax=Pseudodesulfovibrio alkaliphilus TaxID=2661613 RepID=UPI0012DFB741|nr:sensor domain-containing diguanylate cyclase [Pseudodesulfovibrio alkaliphilus]